MEEKHSMEGSLHPKGQVVTLHLTRQKTTRPKLQGHQNLMVTATIARSMVIEILSVDQSLCGHKINQQRLKAMDITTILGRVVTTVRSMKTFLRIALEHISVATTIGA